jgi:hypothetical protein
MMHVKIGTLTGSPSHPFFRIEGQVDILEGEW